MDPIIIIIIIAKGKAAIIEAVCKASRPPPPLSSNTLAVPAIKKPQINFTDNLGFKVPLDVMEANTYVAESADVTKNIKMSIIDIVLVNISKGSFDNIANKAISTSLFTKVPIPPSPNISMLSAVAPNVVNHNKASKEGAISTPVINSRIVLPLEILAMKSPINGAQEICHAQKNIVFAPNHSLFL